ncbi:MAG TPA: hypothetical protein VF384_12020 [Planctomycetota bacterium]
MRWKLFATAQRLLTGKLKIIAADWASKDFRVGIGGKEAGLANGYLMSESELQRIRQLSGKDVIAGVIRSARGTWWVVCTHEAHCIGPRDDWQWEAPAAAFRMLNEDPEWATKALEAENGRWNDAVGRFLDEGDRLPALATLPEASTWETRLTWAADIAGWYVRTLDTVLPDVPHGTVDGEHPQANRLKLRLQAFGIHRQCLDVPLIKPFKNPPLDEPEEVAKSLWMMTRMVAMALHYDRERRTTRR